MIKTKIIHPIVLKYLHDNNLDEKWLKGFCVRHGINEQTGVRRYDIATQQLQSLQFNPDDFFNITLIWDNTEDGHVFWSGHNVVLNNIIIANNENTHTLPEQINI
jgi:hypothetical protein